MTKISQNSVWEGKKIICGRGIELSDGIKGNKKAELSDLCKKSRSNKADQTSLCCRRPQKAVGGEIKNK